MCLVGQSQPVSCLVRPKYLRSLLIPAMLAGVPAFHKQVDLACCPVSPETVTLELDNGAQVSARLAALQHSCKVIADASSGCKIGDVLK